MANSCGRFSRVATKGRGALMKVRIGYCTNVHPANDVEGMLKQWQHHALAVRRRWSESDSMGLGVWLPAEVVRQLKADPALLRQVGQFLEKHELLPFTANGFPYGDFHSAIVKHQVYFPTWWDARRRDYTLCLADILDRWLPTGEPASISTLPISWGSPWPTEAEFRQAAQYLIEVARYLAKLEEGRGRHIILALEPEPGCALQTSANVVAFFERYLLPIDKSLCERYLGVCHDICHAAVMNEPQHAALETYSAYGIRIGKLQVSAAVRVVWDGKLHEQRVTAFRQLASFNEPKYLHQTTARCQDGTDRFFEDLPLALAYFSEAPSDGTWHVHFHVPIYLETFGALDATQDAVCQCLDWIVRHDAAEHWEVETYAWNVLPSELQRPCLADGIWDELQYLRSLWRKLQRSQNQVE